MSRIRALALLTVAALLAVAGVAIAAKATRSTAQVKFSTKKPGKSTSLNLTAKFGHDANGKYAILTNTELRLPKGTKIDTAALTACTATEQQVTDQGADRVCPAGAKLGTGTADVIVGDGTSPLHYEGPLYNFKKQILLELQVGGAPAYEIIGDIKGSKVDFPLTNAEQLGTHPTKVTLKIAKHGTARKPYLRTPTTCPTGTWKGSLFNQYGGGAAAVDNPRFTIACTKDKPKRK